MYSKVTYLIGFGPHTQIDNFMNTMSMATPPTVECLKKYLKPNDRSTANVRVCKSAAWTASTVCVEELDPWHRPVSSLF